MGPAMYSALSNNVANILLDTGSANLLDYYLAKELELNLTPTGENGGCAGGLTYDVFTVDEVSLEISGHHFNYFTSIRNSLSLNGITEDFQGILGFGFFKMTICFIDYSADRIFITE